MSNYEHLEELGGRMDALIRIDKSHDRAGNLVVVKEFLTKAFVDTGFDDLRPGVDSLLPQLRNLLTLPGDDGIAPWLDFEDEGDKVRFVRPYYPIRLVDQFPQEPHSSPMLPLLRAFRGL